MNVYKVHVSAQNKRRSWSVTYFTEALSVYNAITHTLDNVEGAIDEASITIHLMAPNRLLDEYIGPEEANEEDSYWPHL